MKARGTSSGLLNLPAELRNRVYDLMKDDHELVIGEYRFARCPARTSNTGYPPWWSDFPWNSFALCHVNRQLRSEYFPLWLRSLKLQLRPTKSDMKFITIFLRDLPVHKQAPALIQLVWAKSTRAIDEGCMRALFRANFWGNTRIEMIWDIERWISEFSGQPCPTCDMDGALEDMDSTDHGGHENCETALLYYYYDKMDKKLQNVECATRTILDFITNKNENWRQAVLNRSVSAEITSDSVAHREIKILCDEYEWSNIRTGEDAIRLLKHWGMLNPRNVGWAYWVSFVDLMASGKKRKEFRRLLVRGDAI